MIRHEYVVACPDYRPSGRSIAADLTVRPPGAADRDELASLLMDAYEATIDYEGETLEQAVEEVAGYLQGEALLEISRVAEAGAMIQSAVLMSGFGGDPIVGYVMTRAAWKGRGLASALLDLAVAAATEAGHSSVRAFITDGNLPSETVFTRSGFEVVASFADDR